MDQIMIDQEFIVRVDQVQEGDRVLGKPVMKITPINEWMVQLWWANDDETIGLALEASNDLEIPIIRSVPLAEDQCVVCHQHKKIAARHMCGACYQADQRAKKTAQSA